MTVHTAHTSTGPKCPHEETPAASGQQLRQYNSNCSCQASQQSQPSQVTHASVNTHGPRQGHTHSQNTLPGHTTTRPADRRLRPLAAAAGRGCCPRLGCHIRLQQPPAALNTQPVQCSRRHRLHQPWCEAHEQAARAVLGHQLLAGACEGSSGAQGAPACCCLDAAASLLQRQHA